MTLGVQGTLKLHFAYDPNRQITNLEKQFFQPPLHLGKSYWDGEYCFVFLMSPTAGILSGDQLTSEIYLKSDSKAILASPAANRVHTMLGTCGKWDQKIEVAPNAFLEIIPEALVLQKEAQLYQNTKINIETGGELLFWEVLFPGRLFRGERFLFKYFQNNFSVVYGKKLIALERYKIETNSSKKSSSWQNFAKQSVYGSLYLVTEKKDPHFIHDLHQLQEKNLWIGVSPLREGGYSIKILSESPVSFRKIQQRVRTRVYKLLKRSEPDLRSR